MSKVTDSSIVAKIKALVENPSVEAISITVTYRGRYEVTVYDFGPGHGHGHYEGESLAEAVGRARHGKEIE